MPNALLSIVGLYNADDSIFDNMQLPSGVNKQNVIDGIMMDCMELEILYPNPDAMKTMIGIWSRREADTWQRIYNASIAEYNPIENYDRHQTDTRNILHSGSDITTGVSESETTESRNTEAEREQNGTMNGESNSTGTQSGTSSGNTVHQYAAFDSGNLMDQTKDIQSQTVNNSSEETVTNEQTTRETGSDTVSENSTSNTSENTTHTLQHGENVGETFTSYIHGNIGVTTSQQMLESELELSPKLSIINYIVNSFKMRFCILVY